MYYHDSVLTIIAFFSEFLGTISGFGSSTFFVPAAVLVESFKFVLVLTAILHCFGNSSRIFLYRSHFDRKSFILLAIPAVIFTGIGALLTTQFQTALLQRVLGIALMGISLAVILGNRFMTRLPRWAVIGFSIASGFFTGFVGTGGAIRGVALIALGLPKNVFIITSSAVDIGGDFLRAGIYLGSGYMDWQQWFYIPLLGAAAYGGSRLGQVLLHRINQDQFEKIVAVFVFLSGILMFMAP